MSSVSLADLDRHPDINLPVFEANVPILTEKEEYKHAADSGQDSFVRGLLLEGDLSALEIIAIAEEEFQKVARKCGARVVGHEIGLYPLPADDPRLLKYDYKGKIPENHLLSARVEVIKDARPLGRIAEWFTGRCIDAYNAALDTETGYTLVDSCTDQLVRGRLKNRLLRSVYTDIEPRIMRLGSNVIEF